MTATTRILEHTAATPTLYVAFELGNTSWKLGMTRGLGQRPRERNVPARDTLAVRREIARAKEKFGLAPEARVVSCYEAGRDGFWLHRFLQAHGVESQVVDAASIEISRRFRRVKTDRIDVHKLLAMLVRHDGGERRVWSVVRVPSADEEDRRQLHRELLAAKRDRTRVTNRIQGLLANQGVVLSLHSDLPAQLERVRRWDGTALPRALQARVLREWAKVELLTQQIRALEAERREEVRQGTDRPLQQVRQLLALRGIGANSAWVYVMELFGWRRFHNGKEVGSVAGLVPTPHTSGDLQRELGITKAGNRYVRSMAIEIAWGWLRFQPQSRLARWYQERFGNGNSRARRIGIVALARKLLVALWRYLETGLLPEGAELKLDARVR